MAFGWREFGQGVAGAGQTVASLLLADHQRKQRLADQMKMWKEQQKITEASNIKLTEHRATLQEEFMNKQADLQTGLKTFGSRETMNYFTQAMQSGNSFQQMQGQALLGSINKLQRGEELSEQEWQVVGQFNPQAQVHLSQLQKGVQGSQIKLQSTQALTKYYGQLTQESKLRVGKMNQALEQGIIPFEKAVKNFKDASEQIERILSSDGYMMLSRQVREAGEDWMSKLDLETIVKPYLALSGQLNDFFEIQRISKAVMKKFVPEAFEPPPRPEEQPLTKTGIDVIPALEVAKGTFKEVMEAPFKEAGRPAKEKLQAGIGKAYAWVKKGGETKREYEKEDIKKLRREYNIPKDRMIHLSDDVDKLKREGKEGELVVFQGELWIIGRKPGGTVLGLLRYAK